MPLTDIAVRSAKPRDKAYKLADGQGMYLEAMPNGSKYWRLRHRIDGKERRAALGVYPAVSLLAARKAREEIKNTLRADLDPSKEKKRAAEQRQPVAVKQRIVADAFDEYGRRVSIKKEGAKWEPNRLNMFVRDFPEYARRSLSDADTPMWAEWRDTRLNGFTRSDGKVARPVKTGTVLREMNLYRNVFTIARKEWKWIDANPFTDVGEPPDGPPRERRPDPWKEIRPNVRWLGNEVGRSRKPKIRRWRSPIWWRYAVACGRRSCLVWAKGRST